MFLERLSADVAEVTPSLIVPTQHQTWARLDEQISSLAAGLTDRQGSRVGLLVAPTIESVTRLFALLSTGVHTFLMAHDASEDELAELSRAFGLATIFRPDGSEARYDSGSGRALPGAVTILTSGTTGKPKAAQHTLDSLLRPVRRTDHNGHPRWLLTYRPHLYAGLQVIMQCMVNHGTLIMPSSGSSAEDVVQLARQARAEFASATPSYWRWLLAMGGEPGKIPLKQITLGGEAVDQVTLDALKRCFRDARLVHIYATTELGRCFSVTDGLAGFPIRYLEHVSSDGVELRIDDGELVVRSANAMASYGQTTESGSTDDVPSQSWFPTGDLVQTIGDRVFFVGRKSDMINVGGNKVYPIEVENVIRSVPGVADTRVYGEPSSVVGELVKCDLVVARGFAIDAVEKAVRQTTLERLSAFQRPRLVSIVDEIPRTTAGKTARR